MPQKTKKIALLYPTWYWWVPKYPHLKIKELVSDSSARWRGRRMSRLKRDFKPILAAVRRCASEKEKMILLGLPLNWKLYHPYFQVDLGKTSDEESVKRPLSTRFIPHEDVVVDPLLFHLMKMLLWPVVVGQFLALIDTANLSMSIIGKRQLLRGLGMVDRFHP